MHPSSLRSGRPGALIPVLVALLLGCATRALPPGEQGTALTAEALKRTEAMYLYPDRIDRRMMVGALDALELRFDSVRFADQGDTGILEVGTAKADVPIANDFEVDGFRSTLGQALYFVGANLDEELDESEGLELIALQGALLSLDPYSTVFSGRNTEDFTIRFSGKLHGIGARIGRRDGHLTAMTVFPDSPAERGGLEEGDWIVTIDGRPTRPLSVGEAVGQIRGEIDTSIVLGVMRGEAELEVTIIRGEVTIPSVEARSLEDGIGYARIDVFSATTAEEFRDKVLELGEIDGLVLDLRGNTGGSMGSATKLADLFLEQQLIARVVDRNGEPQSRGRTRWIARPPVLFQFPVVILVDHATASASEILSGALSPLDSVTIIGQTTFGKGVIQQVLPLPQGNLLKLTVAEYRLSKNRIIHETGIEPDITLHPVSSLRLGALAQVPDAALPYLRKPGEPDTFPIDAAAALLTSGPDAGLQRISDRADEGIALELSNHEIRWATNDELPARMPAPLEIAETTMSLSGGEEGTMRLRIRNPNPFAIPDAWAALEAPTTYLSNKLIALGTLPAGGEVDVEIPLTPPPGLSTVEHPVTLHVASGNRPIHSDELTLHVEPQAPELAIEVERISDEAIRVSVTNRGVDPIPELRVFVPGDTQSIDELGADDSEELTLQLTAEPDEVAIVLSGPWAQRRILVPIPDTTVRVALPAVELRRGGLPGRPQIRVEANASDGLREGWILLDGQKEAYIAWQGDKAGTLRAPLGEGAHDVMTKVETLSGVSIIDVRRLTAN
jgi:carboxyl-terminal processing protease